MDFLYDKIPYILTVCGVIAASMFLSCAIVGNVLHDDVISNKIISDENAAAMKKRLEQKMYDNSFYDELEALEDIDLTKADIEKLAFSSIEEDTPSGKIKMCYSCDTETFWYYSKNKHIHYPTLDAVARRYSVKHNCAQICINYRKEVENGSIKMKASLEKCSEVDDTPSVYVKLKSYNKNISSNKKLVTVERSNRFTYKGCIRGSEHPVAPEIKKISFMEYKQILESDKIKTC